MGYDRDYGSRGRIGIVTPQANPTVEPEIGVLLPAGVSMVVARCTSAAEPEQRLRDYLDNLAGTLRHFDTMPLEAVGFACTGSTYLAGHERESRQLQALEAQFGYPIVSAAQGIEAALRSLGAQRIAVACPYPTWLLRAAEEYWASRGFDVVGSSSLQPDTGDTRSIYALSGDDAREAVRRHFSGIDADALLITGTGMPSLRLVAELSRESRVPALSSNLCLAWQCLARAGIDPAERSPSDEMPLLDGWRDALDHL